MVNWDDVFDKEVDESTPNPFETFDDFSALRIYGCISIAQCSVIASWMLRPGSTEEPDFFEIACHYIHLAYVDITNNCLNAKHPRTQISHSEYRRMMEAGITDTPFVNSNWLIPLDKAEQWLKSKNIYFNKDVDNFLEGLRDMAGEASPESKLALTAVVGDVPTSASTVHDWQSQARVIADELFDIDTQQGCRRTLENYSSRVMEEMQKRGISGPRGIIDNANTVMRDALQGKKWWATKQK